MANWHQITFSEIKNAFKNSEKIAFHIQKMSYIPSILAHGIVLILLLKMSQVVLEWHF